MDKNRNIDITRVPKGDSFSVSNKSPKNSTSADRVETKPLALESRKSKKNKINSKFGYFTALRNSFISVFSSDIFALSFLSNLFSVRVWLFVLMPFIYIQIKYLFILKPDQILNKLKAFLSPENTFVFMMWGLFFISIAIISWLLDSLISPAIYRYKFQMLDDRDTKMNESLRDILKNFLVVVFAKFVKFLIAATILVIIIGLLYLAYVLGYGSLNSQVGGFVIIAFVAFLITLLFINYSFCLNIISSVELYDGKHKYRRIIRQILTHPLSAFGYSLSWLASLILVVFISAGFVILEVGLLQSNSLNSGIIAGLAILTTLIYLLWSAWTAAQAGYWTTIIHSGREEMQIRFGNAGEGSFVGLVIILVILCLVIGGYLVSAFLFSSQVSDTLMNIWSKLPNSTRLNLSKPQ